MNREERMGTLKEEELLLRHQLNVAHYWQNRMSGDVGCDRPAEATSNSDTVPEKWDFLIGVQLHSWQIECRNKWFDCGKRGVVKVVTGAGKTILALAIAQELQNNVDRELRVAIIVPTIVLLGQWYDVIINCSNLPTKMIARLGGGFDESFSEDKRIMIAVMASAYKKLPNYVRRAKVGQNLLLIVDECHRVGAEKMSEVLKTDRQYSLGLSATPEREEIPEEEDEESAVVKEFAEDPVFEETILGHQLGPIIYELTFDEAVKRGILPRFEIRHYGLPLAREERITYDKYSREITELRRRLRESSESAKNLDGGALVGWARKLSLRSGSKIAEVANDYVKMVRVRKQLLYHATSREKAVIDILSKVFQENPDSRAILFHESIDEVMRLFYLIRSKGFPAVPEHSKLPESLRAESIYLFRKGTAKVLISAKSLIEGFDVPAADVGIVVASSSSVRQRIQTLGRILRKHKTSSGEQKEAVLHVLYITNTVDELIYEKNDWGSVTGAERNLYYLWDPELDRGPVLQPGPPRLPLPDETKIDWEALKVGDIYPGRYEGLEYSCDSKANISDSSGRIASNPQGVDEMLKRTKGSFGRFRVTPRKLAVLVRVNENGIWATKLAGFLKEPFRFEGEKRNSGNLRGEIDKLAPGDVYPGETEPREEFLIKRRTKGIKIAKKIKGGEIFAKIGDDAFDPEKGEDAQKVIEAIQKAYDRDGNWVSKFSINAQNHAFYMLEGKARFLCVIKKGLEFPEISVK